MGRAAGAIALVVAGLRPVQPAGEPLAPRALRTAIGAPLTLDPARARSVHEHAVIVQLFSRLVECDASLALRPSLARSWTVSSDGRVYTFELAAARFHNGREVEAADVAGSLRRLLAGKRAGPASGLAALVEGAREEGAGPGDPLAGVRVLGPKRLEIRLAEPYAPLLSLLSSPALSIVPAGEAEAAGDGFGRHPMGSGPFRLELWDDAEIRLRAHDGAPEGPPLTPAVSFRLLPAGAGYERILALLLARELDYVLVPPGLASAAQQVPRGYRRERHAELTVLYIGFDTQGGAAADVRLRRGFRAGLDRAALAREMSADSALLADSMIPAELAPNRREPPGVEPGTARALFRELAAAGRRPRLRLHYAEGRGFDPGFEWLARRMSELGLDLLLAPSPSPLALQLLHEQGRVEAWFGGVQAQHPDPGELLRGLFGSRGTGRNWFSYASPEVDRLLDAARAALDPGQRARLYSQLDETLARDVPAIPLWGRTYQYFVGSRVRGLAPPFLPSQMRLAGVRLEP